MKKRNTITKLLLIALVVTGIAFIWAANDEPTVGERVDSTLESTQDAAESAWDNTTDATEDAWDKVKDAAEDTKDKVEDAADEATDGA